MDLENSLLPLLQSQLTQTNMPILADAMALYTSTPFVPRQYYGYPEWVLPKLHPRHFTSLEKNLRSRRSKLQLGAELPSSAQLGRILWFGHGLFDAEGHGPVPSAGGLSGLHLYLVVFPSEPTQEKQWLPEGIYHYQRARHILSQLSSSAKRKDWQELAPSLLLTKGGKILWIIVGETSNICAKYAFRAHRYLLLEAGHLMQNLCLLSESVDLCTVPLGGILESDVANKLLLPRTDVVLYGGLCGK